MLQCNNIRTYSRRAIITMYVTSRSVFIFVFYIYFFLLATKSILLLTLFSRLFHSSRVEQDTVIVPVCNTPLCTHVLRAKSVLSVFHPYFRFSVKSRRGILSVFQNNLYQTYDYYAIYFYRAGIFMTNRL